MKDTQDQKPCVFRTLLTATLLSPHLTHPLAMGVLCTARLHASTGTIISPYYKATTIMLKVSHKTLKLNGCAKPFKSN
eukprot:3440466-Ditylum_brightwellii.AAC.1